MQCAAGKITSERQNDKTNVSKVIGTEYISKLSFPARRKFLHFSKRLLAPSERNKRGEFHF